MRGFYKDKLTNSNDLVIWESDWSSNLIVRNCNVLLASLMKRQEGMQGILYWAVGEGASDWDSQSPRPDLTDSMLVKELIRKPIATDNIEYIDNQGNPTVTPSIQLEITSKFKGEDFASGGLKQLREFALFGGDATEEIETGMMINRVIHPRIDITPELRLVRKVHLDFRTGAIKPDELSGFGSSLPVESIDGVGGNYASALKGVGIETLNNLANVNPLDPVADIPLVKLREFRAKARMVINLKVTLSPFNLLKNHSISDILMKDSEAILEIIGTEEGHLEMVIQLQNRLDALQVALDDQVLKNTKLGDL